MATICLALHAHLPQVLRHYSVFDRDPHYFDAFRSREACRRLAQRSILPANRILLGLVRRGEGRFRFSFSVTGVALDLFERFAPEVIISWQALAETGCVEVLGTTYDNSLALPYSRGALCEQIELHRERMTRLFKSPPRVLRNSELIYGEELATIAAELGFSGILCDGVYDVLAGRTCNRVYASAEGGIPLLLRNERFSRDVSERFTDRGWDQWPLTAPRFAERLAEFESDCEVVTLAWNYTTFGLRVPADAGIFDFLRYLPEKVQQQAALEFRTAGEALDLHEPAEVYRPDRVVSTAEALGSLSTWLGNPMQSHAAHRLYALEPAIRASGDEALLSDWRRLQACEYLGEMTMSGGPSDHLRLAAASPYDAFINFMNLCDSLAERCGVALPV